MIRGWSPRHIFNEVIPLVNTRTWSNRSTTWWCDASYISSLSLTHSKRERTPLCTGYTSTITVLWNSWYHIVQSTWQRDRLFTCRSPKWEHVGTYDYDGGVSFNFSQVLLPRCVSVVTLTNSSRVFLPSHQSQFSHKFATHPSLRQVPNGEYQFSTHKIVTHERRWDEGLPEGRNTRKVRLSGGTEHSVSLGNLTHLFFALWACKFYRFFFNMNQESES